MPRILVVDDCRDTTSSLSMLLSLLGHDVRAANDGRTALTIAAAFRPEAALVDLVMPGMDGYEVARRLRRIPGMENAFLLAMTGYGSRGEGRRAPEGDFDLNLIKPVDPEDLARLLRDAPAHS